MAASITSIKTPEQVDQMNKFLQENSEELKDAFSIFDRKGTGFIALSNLGLASRTLGFNTTEAVLDDLVNDVDIDGSGIIDFIEFIEMMNYLWTREVDSTVRNIFEVFDLNDSGTIDSEEFQLMMTSFGHEDFTEEDSLEMISLADTDGSGQIDIEEFAQMLSDNNRTLGCR